MSPTPAATPAATTDGRSRLAAALPLVTLLVAVSCGDDEVQVDEAPAVQAAPSAATKTPPPAPTRVELKNGLVIETLVHGEGLASAVGDTLSVHYTALATESGEELLTTRATGIPFRFALGRREVIRGLDRGLVGARAGARIRLTVPAELAYGAAGLDPVPADTDLTFEVDVIDVRKAP